MLDLISPVNDVFRRDIPVDDPDSLLDPNESTTALEAGEWLIADAVTGKAIRAGTLQTETNIMQVFSQRGDVAAQAIDKTAVLYLHDYEAETDMFDPAPAIPYVLGLTLTVDQVAIDTVTRSALTSAATGDLVHGIVTKLPANNRGKLRFIKTSPYVAL
jgi:hypothetical protein